jgi:hypothetical protein
VWRLLDLFFPAMVFALILANRSAFFRYQPSINVDEALFAANAMRSSYGWTNWGMIDPTTSGPLNSIILTWPRIFGGDITLFSGRLIATLLASGTAAFIYLTARKLMPAPWAVAAALPASLFYATTRHFDFVYFSSEQLPVFLVAGSIYFLVCATIQSGLLNCAIAAFLAGLIPFAKLQGLPWAALLGLAALIISIQSAAEPSRKTYFAATTIVFGMLPAALFLVPLVITGDFDDFVNSYLVQQYLRSVGARDPAPLLLAWSVPTMRALIVTAGAIVAISGAVSLAQNRERVRRLTRTEMVMSLLSISTLLVAFASVAFPRRSFPHYVQLLIPAISLLVIFATSLVASLNLRRIKANAVIFMICCASILPTMIWGFQKLSLPSDGRNSGSLVAPRSLSWLQPREDDTIVCWGWQPECYVDSAMKSATRDATNENQLYETRLLPYFRNRFIADVKKSRPDFIADFTGPGGRFSSIEQHSIRAFPEFNELVSADFELMSAADPIERCPRLYVRKSRSKALSKALVEFDNITGPSDGITSPRAVDDRSIFESCQDYWLLPKGELGTLTITFKSPAAVKSVAILNTNNATFDERAADRVRLSLMDSDRTIATREMALNRFPQWTIVELTPSPQIATSLKIEILSFIGSGGGINEVKVYTPVLPSVP